MAASVAAGAAEQWSTKTSLARVVEFHGHMCPGFAIGIRAAEVALAEVGHNGVSQEAVPVVETDMSAGTPSSDGSTRLRRRAVVAADHEATFPVAESEPVVCQRRPSLVEEMQRRDEPTEAFVGSTSRRGYGDAFEAHHGSRGAGSMPVVEGLVNRLDGDRGAVLAAQRMKALVCWFLLLGPAVRVESAVVVSVQRSDLRRSPCFDPKGVLA